MSGQNVLVSLKFNQATHFSCSYKHTMRAVSQRSASQRREGTLYKRSFQSSRHSTLIPCLIPSLNIMWNTSKPRVHRMGSY